MVPAGVVEVEAAEARYRLKCGGLSPTAPMIVLDPAAPRPAAATACKREGACRQHCYC
jgi:hypothetical protein